MRDVSIPHWLRVLVWGLLASLVLHWVALDLMRGAVSLQPVRGRAVLQASFEQNAYGIASVAPASVAPMPARQPEAAVAQHSAKAPTQAPALDAPLVPAMAQVSLRSGKPAEAMVALRLTLASLLTNALAITWQGQAPISEPLMLWCDFDEAGRLVEVRGVSAALQTRVRHAAADVVLPEVLMGRRFSLDLLLESD